MDTDHQRDHRRLIVVALYFLAAFWGFVQVLSTNALVYVLCSLLFATLATSWCVHDAWRRDRPMLPIVQVVIFFTWPVAVPIFLILSRRAGGVVSAWPCCTGSG